MYRNLAVPVVVLALAGVLFAVPAGPGGTLYLGGIDTTNKNQSLWYVDVDSNWNPVLSSNAVVNFATIKDDVPQTTNGYGMQSAWFNGVTGKLDMNGQYHNGNILMASYYDSNAAGSVGTGASRGADILSVNANTGVTILNGGINAPQATAVGTADQRWYVAVDSGFTPNPTDGKGFATSGNWNRGVWTNNGSGNYTVGTDPGYALGPSGNWQFAGSYSACNTTVNGQAVTGVAYNLYMTSGSLPNFVFTYKLAAGGYTQVVNLGSNANYASSVYTSGLNAAMVADVDNDGVPNFFYHGNSLSHHLIMGEDANGDGDFNESGETVDTGVVWAWSADSAGFAKCPDGSWVFIVWDYTLGSTATIKVYGLNASGLWDGTVKTIITTTYNTGTGTWSGDSSLNVNANASALIFMPLGDASTQQAPEPATLMLVGSGVLGLAGVLRRRFLN